MDWSSKVVSGTTDDIRQSNLSRPIHYSSSRPQVRGTVADCFRLRRIRYCETSIELGPDSNVHLSNSGRD